MNADKRGFKQDRQDLQDRSFSYLCLPVSICGQFFLKIFASLCLCGLIFVFTLKAQDLPDEIRGYKVHKAKISVQTGASRNSAGEDFRVIVDFDAPQLVGITPLGATFQVSGEMTVFDQSGKIDFLTFRDFRVNGLKVEIEEYREPFEIEKNKPARLKKPIKIFVSATQSIKGGLKEIFRSETEWQVTGRAFVFGKFKKMGFKFKRVVPVDVNLKIVNPLRESEP
ncbi:MAG TPA: hypothetical protein VK400_19905, partial [Pyrinomonadaceae bacterium]|nr:hypothetical protein [Pyrinomonadaceae bacterium]